MDPNKSICIKERWETEFEQEITTKTWGENMLRRSPAQTSGVNLSGR